MGTEHPDRDGSAGAGSAWEQGSPNQAKPSGAAGWVMFPDQRTTESDKVAQRLWDLGHRSGMWCAWYSLHSVGRTACSTDSGPTTSPAASRPSEIVESSGTGGHIQFASFPFPFPPSDKCASPVFRCAGLAGRPGRGSGDGEDQHTVPKRKQRCAVTQSLPLARSSLL